MDLSSVDWVALGKGLGVAAAAGLTAAGAARRMWKKGLGDLLRPVVASEARKALKGLAAELRSVVGEAVAPLKQEVEELRESHEELRERVEALEACTGHTQPKRHQ